MDDLTGQIIAYEQGELTIGAMLRLFAHLVQTGLAWSLQGHYGRTAAQLIDNGFLTRGGALTERARIYIAQEEN